MTQKIRLYPYTKKQLEGLKTDEIWTFDSVICFLLDEHFEINDPDIIKEKEKKLNDEYVDRSEYSRLYAENIDNRKKIKELTDGYETKLEHQLGELRGNEENTIIKLKEQQDNSAKLQDALTLTQTELGVLIPENKKLKQDLDNLNFILSDAQKKYDKCDTQYNILRNHVDRSCVEVDVLKALSRIVSFLSRNKRVYYTTTDLCSIFPVQEWENVEEALDLWSIEIFPIRKYKMKDKTVCYQFDRHYLKH